jgi:hypothetical protein
MSSCSFAPTYLNAKLFGDMSRVDNHVYVLTITVGPAQLHPGQIRNDQRFSQIEVTQTSGDRS